MDKEFVCINDYGLLGSNFYWVNRHKVEGLADEMLSYAGLTDDKVFVHRDIIDVLIEIDKEFQRSGFRAYIKEGYRSKELYKLIYEKRVDMFGKDRTEKLLNMIDMPHATGKTVDVTFFDVLKNEEVLLRDKKDGDDAFFVNFYRGRAGVESAQFQRLQDLLIDTMLKYGFRLGKRNEYFHFDYKPEMEANYNKIKTHA